MKVILHKKFFQVVILSFPKRILQMANMSFWIIRISIMDLFVFAIEKLMVNIISIQKQVKITT